MIHRSSVLDSTVHFIDHTRCRSALSLHRSNRAQSVLRYPETFYLDKVIDMFD